MIDLMEYLQENNCLKLNLFTNASNICLHIYVLKHNHTVNKHVNRINNVNNRTNMFMITIHS